MPLKSGKSRKLMILKCDTVTQKEICLIISSNLIRRDGQSSYSLHWIKSIYWRICTVNSHRYVDILMKKQRYACMRKKHANIVAHTLNSIFSWNLSKGILHSKWAHSTCAALLTSDTYSEFWKVLLRCSLIINNCSEDGHPSLIAKSEEWSL
jgi:hypothetical protein